MGKGVAGSSPAAVSIQMTANENDQPDKADHVRPLVTCRFLFQSAKAQFSGHLTPWHTGVGISLLQDSVELMLRQIAAESNIRITDNTGFVQILDKLTATEPIPSHSRLHELNKARVNFKHYGNLPAIEEGARLEQYAESFLLWASDRYLSTDFRSVSLSALIKDPEIRTEIETAEYELAKSIEATDEESAINFRRESISAVARAWWLYKHLLSKELPEVDHKLKSPPRLGSDINSASTQNLFAYVGNYLEILRDFVAGLSQGVPNEYRYFLESCLPSVIRTMNGKYQYTYRRRSPSNLTTDDAQRCIDIVTEISLSA